MKQEMIGRQWHQLDHKQIIAPRCRQITKPAPHHSFFAGRMLFLMPNQRCQSTEVHRQYIQKCKSVFPYVSWDNCRSLLAIPWCRILYLVEKKSSYPIWPYLCLIYFAYTTDCACIHFAAEEYLDSGIYYIVHILLKPERLVFLSYTDS